MTKEQQLNALLDFLDLPDHSWKGDIGLSYGLVGMAEQELTGQQRDIYVHRLLSLGTPFQAMTATAEQRAKELLKVIGKWKD